MVRRAKRSRRQEEPERGAPQAGHKATKASSTWRRGTNTVGLPILPDELLLEILSHYPAVPLPSDEEGDFQLEAYLARRDTLLALAKSCSNLRRFFHPYVWERVEVCDGMPVGKTKLTRDGGKEDEKAFAVELIRQLEIVTIRDPDLARHVRIVNVEITEYSVHNVLVELGRCLSRFEKLHTVKLHMPSSSKIEIAVKRGFQKHVYPQIRNLILSPVAYPLLESCPNLKSISCLNYRATAEMLDHIVKCPEVIATKCFFQPHELQLAAARLPNVREIGIVIDFWDGVSDNLEEALEDLRLMTKLEVVHIDLFCMDVQKLLVLGCVTRHLLALQKEDSVTRSIHLRSGTDFSDDGDQPHFDVEAVIFFAPTAIGVMKKGSL